MFSDTSFPSLCPQPRAGTVRDRVLIRLDGHHEIAQCRAYES